MTDKHRIGFHWNRDSKERKALERAGTDSAIGVIFIGIGIAAGLIGAGIIKIVSVFREL